MRGTRRGFTFVELMISMTIVGLLGSIAVPKYRAIKRQALAAQVIGDFDVVRVAALSFFVDSGYFPKESASGKVPKGLGNYLPRTFQMKQPEWTLDYEYYYLKPSKKFAGKELVGVSAKTADAALGETAMAMLGSGASVMINGKLTFFIAGM